MVVVVVFLFGILIPNSGSRPVHRSQRIACVNNLKHIGLALRIFSTDHGGVFPMELSVTNHGSREWLTDEAQLWRHWLLLSHELVTPEILLCPSDKERQPAKRFWSGSTPTWGAFTNNARLSYFLGLNANEERPESILAGDRNLMTNHVAVGPGRLVLTGDSALGFTTEMHGGCGAALFGDGSVQQLTSGRLDATWRSAQTKTNLTTNVWLVP